MKNRAMLALADGAIFEGYSFGAEGETWGEVVFNTAMTGYQEILTDPSYKGQIVSMTYPLIGNYGINPEDIESRKPFVEGFVVRELSRIYSNWRAELSLDQYLKEHGIMGIEGIDTRELTMRLREAGAQTGIISTEDLNPDSLVEKARSLPTLEGRDLAKEVTCKEIFCWEEGTWVLGEGYQKPRPFHPVDPKKVPIEGAQMPREYRVVAYDFGIKFNILRILSQWGCRVIVVPAEYPAEEVLKLRPHGLFLSNGPGDPAPLHYAIENTRKLIGKVPIFGICLGHQILSLALGGKTYKLKFGHHGANHPVKNLSSGEVEITSQNHGFAVDPGSLGPNVEVTHVNLNDHTVEGMRHTSLPIFSVQYHPEASPGPHDSSYLFKRFVEMMEELHPHL